MHDELIIDAFEKAEKQLIGQGVNAPSKRQLSIELSSYLADDYGYPLGDRSLRDYYDASISSEDVNIANIKIVEGLCQYLGYNDYQAYCKSKSSPDTSLENNSRKTAGPNRRKRNLSIGIGMLSIAFMVLFLIFKPTDQKWMVWNYDHYEEVPFSKTELKEGRLKIYKEDRMLYFKKVTALDCGYQFFNEDASVRLWYGKNHEARLEYFTDFGLHPETGKTLKPITTYMIRKYLCNSY